MGDQRFSIGTVSHVKAESEYPIPSDFYSKRKNFSFKSDFHFTQFLKKLDHFHPSQPDT